jgi:hypothetical protein
LRRIVGLKSLKFVAISAAQGPNCDQTLRSFNAIGKNGTDAAPVRRKVGARRAALAAGTRRRYISRSFQPQFFPK